MIEMHHNRLETDINIERDPSSISTYVFQAEF